MRLELALAAVLLVPWSAQDPAPQDPEPPKPFPLSDNALSGAVAEGVEGAWQLERIESTAFPVNPGDVVGYVLFHQGYLSLEIHGVSQYAFEDTDGEFFQTGFHRYSFDETGGMETYSLIGVSNVTEDEEVLFLDPGERRRFRVWLADERLTLERNDGTRLMFRKLGKLPFPGAVEQVDAFGRPVKSSSTPPAPEEKQR